ncbi:SAM-dependent methyltransferase [Plantactinospora sp. GCM10030261]|uniref:SAM-dependent methyltransferase n=1 Tax=Plantactinospora sp. GCM10030261 TaxID=3273420 RepID=UPI0036186B4A
MAGSDVPWRLRWTVDLLDVRPDDQILEIGCGPGVAVSLIADRLDGGQVTAIDRSATAIDRATRRNAGHVAGGRARIRRLDLAGVDGLTGPFTAIFAVNVNVFWVRDAAVELRMLDNLLVGGGRLLLVFEAPGSDRTDRVLRAVADAVRASGFRATVTRHSATLGAVIARS